MPTATIAADAFPIIDATQQDCITDAQAQFFRDNGLLVLRNVVRGAELSALRDQTLPLVQKAMESADAPDTLYTTHSETGERVPFRVEYVVDKTSAGKSLLGNPFILRSVEKLQGVNFFPTWDSMVFKREGAGAAIPWHRDGGLSGVAGDAPIFNVDFYLDEADMTNCLWGILGSNKWTQEEAGRKIKQLNDGGFRTDENTVPIPMQPGDVIFHNILALHGSPAAQSKLRRVLYYEFRPAEVEFENGPHSQAYIPVKQKVLLACLRHRAESPYAEGETPFTYQPSPEFTPPALGPGEELPTYRYAHEDYKR